jgi:hypothetical protein
LLGGQGGGGASSGHDDVNLERNQLGRKSREPLELPLGISVFDHDIAALDVTEGTQSLEEGPSQVRVSARVERQEAYSRGFGSRRLRLDREGHGEETEGANDERPSLRSSSDHGRPLGFRRWSPANRTTTPITTPSACNHPKPGYRPKPS